MIRSHSFQLRLEEFLKLYHTLNWPIVPLSTGTKIPFKGFPLHEYLEDSSILSEEEITKYFEQNPQPNVGLVTGGVHRLVVLDFENVKDALLFQPNLTRIASETIVNLTAHGGIHIYLRSHESVRTIFSVCGGEHPFDIIANGKYIVAPPSVIDHSKCDKSKCNLQGFSKYEVVRSHLLTEKFLLVKGLIDSTISRCKEIGWTPKKINTTSWAEGTAVNLQDVRYEFNDPPCIQGILQNVPKGNRDNASIMLASYLVNWKRFRPEEALQIMVEWLKAMKDPYRDLEGWMKQKIQSAVNGGYYPGCNALAEWCSKTACSKPLNDIIKMQSSADTRLIRSIRSINTISHSPHPCRNNARRGNDVVTHRGGV